MKTKSTGNIKSATRESFSTALKPWARGPFELLRHAEGHLKAGTDFDKRMALISFDNAIEVAITTYLRLHPTQRKKRAYQRDAVEKWVANYHSKLAFFFDEYAKDITTPFPTTLEEIIWYHDLRNDLYHAGNGFVPEAHSLSGARIAALWVFSTLFQINAEQMLAETVSPPIPSVTSKEAVFPAQMQFLQSFIQLEKSLSASLQLMGLPSSREKRAPTFRESWSRFRSECPVPSAGYDSIIQKAQLVRNSLVHGKSAELSDEELLKLSTELDEISKLASSYAFSFDILSALKKRYPQWLRPDITSARIIQRAGMVFLEIVNRKGKGPDEHVTRTELSFITSGEMPMFSPSRTAYENAELLLRNLDPYSIINSTDLFTPEGAQQVAQIYGRMSQP